MAGPEVFGINRYSESRDVVGQVVTTLKGVTDRRGLFLQDFRSRAIPRWEIHELMLTDESVEPGSTVDRVALIAFFEVVEGGLIPVGSEVLVGEQRLGVVAGFDETHTPNHYNICLSSDEFIDGENRGIRVGDTVRFRFQPAS